MCEGVSNPCRLGKWADLKPCNEAQPVIKEADIAICSPRNQEAVHTSQAVDWAAVDGQNLGSLPELLALCIQGQGRPQNNLPTVSTGCGLQNTRLTKAAQM